MHRKIKGVMIKMHQLGKWVVQHGTKMVIQALKTKHWEERKCVTYYGIPSWEKWALSIGIR